MLGVYRPTVSLVQARLEKQELIRHSRGQIEIIDRPGLLAISCECYELIRALYQETFEALPASIAKPEAGLDSIGNSR